MKFNDPKDFLSELDIDELETMPLEDLSSGAFKNLESEVKKTTAVLRDAKIFRKKSKLQLAREAIDNQKQSISTDRIRAKLKSMGKDPHGVLIDLLVAGKLNQNLKATLAFRDGKDLPEEEAEQILRDLVELGVWNIEE